MSKVIKKLPDPLNLFGGEEGQTIIVQPSSQPLDAASTNTALDGINPETPATMPVPIPATPSATGIQPSSETAAARRRSQRRSAARRGRTSTILTAGDDVLGA